MRGPFGLLDEWLAKCAARVWLVSERKRRPGKGRDARLRMHSGPKVITEKEVFHATERAPNCRQIQSEQNRNDRNDT